MKSVVVVLSGGLDSITLLHKLHKEEWEIKSCVSFNYGQRHKKELTYAKEASSTLGITHHIIDLWSSGITDALAPSGSSLVTSTDVPDGHYAEENMKVTVVPNRNMMMLSIAGAIAVAEGANAIATAVHAGDHFIYPDCRSGFITTAAAALYLGNEGFGNLWRAPIWAPFMNKSKADIAELAMTMHMDLSKTWSCYKGGEIHCGTCGTCVERLEAIDIAANRLGIGIGYDTTIYENFEFWKMVVNNEVS